MHFADEATITIRSGDGGNGCVSFRREKYVPKGGPDGGDGGCGGSIYCRVNPRLRSLTEFKRRRLIRSRNGTPGRGKNQTGADAPDVFLEVPVGTLIEDLDTGEVLADLVQAAQSILLAQGGRGGKGNQHFATATHRTPRFAQPGSPGMERRLRLTLKFLADIGLIGLPNAGKSTLLAYLTQAHPKIGNYPFTTLAPNLGVLHLGGEEGDGDLIIADIPGLIQGASEGRGLGHRFLKHVERTKVLLHLLDVTYQPREDLLEDFRALQSELGAFAPDLLVKPQLVVITKMDLWGPEHRSPTEMQAALKEQGLDAVAVSAFTGEGIPELMTLVRRRWGAWIAAGAQAKGMERVGSGEPN